MYNGPAAGSKSLAPHLFGARSSWGASREASTRLFCSLFASTPRWYADVVMLLPSNSGGRVCGFRFEGAIGLFK